MLLRASRMLGPVFAIALSMRLSADGPTLATAPGFHAASTATAPATCGVAWEVPPCVIPAAVMSAPGASEVRIGADWEKHVIWSCAVVLSVH
jgi:hypothetical protein